LLSLNIATKSFGFYLIFLTSSLDDVNMTVHWCH